MNLLKPLVRVSFVTMCSRVLGFIRDVIIARLFGVSIMTDAFFIAFKLPNLLRRIFAEGACYQVFLPMLSTYKYCNNKKEIQIFVSRACGLLTFTLVIIVIIGLLIAPWIIIIAAPGFKNCSEKFVITILLFRIMFPYILFISLTSLMGSVLNAWNSFLVPAFAPIFLNISMIIFMLFSEYLYFSPSIIGLAWSVIIGGFLQCIFYLPFLKKIDFLVLPELNFYDKKIRKICRAMRFILISASSSQISLVINTILSSFLISGSVSWMYYADRIIELPIGVFGVTLTTVLLPYLSRFIATDSNIEYLKLMNWGMKLCFLLGFPSAIILGVLSKPLIITLFQYGKFSEFDVLMTQYSVIVYSIGLPGLILVKVLTAGFYANHDTKTPVRMVTITIVFTQLINFICIHSLKHVAFACSVSLGAWLHAGLLYWQLIRKHSFQLQSGWLCFMYQLIISLIVMSIILYIEFLFLIPNYYYWEQDNFMYRLLRLLGLLILGISSYCMTLWCLGLRVKDFYFLYKDSG